VAVGGNVSSRKRNIKTSYVLLLFFFWGQCLMARNMGVMKSGRKKKRVWTNENGKTLGKVRGKTKKKERKCNRDICLPVAIC